MCSSDLAEGEADMAKPLASNDKEDKTISDDTSNLFDEIKENSRKNNLELSNEINNLYSKKITQLTDVSLKLEDRQNKTELNNQKIFSQLIELENKIDSLVKDLDQKVKINNSPNINKETKNPTQIHETDLEQILETLNLNSNIIINLPFLTEGKVPYPF